jgi:hypothetical protein
MAACETLVRSISRGRQVMRAEIREACLALSAFGNEPPELRLGSHREQLAVSPPEHVNQPLVQKKKRGPLSSGPHFD